MRILYFEFLINFLLLGICYTEENVPIQKERNITKYIGLGNLFKLEKKYDNAIKHYETALHLLEQPGVNETENLIELYKQLYPLYLVSKEREKADLVLSKFHNLSLVFQGISEPDSFLLLVQELHKLKEFELAEEMLNDYMKIYTKKYGETDVSVIRGFDFLARHEILQQHFRTALTYFRRALIILDITKVELPEDTFESLTLVAGQLFFAEEKFSLANGLLKKYVEHQNLKNKTLESYIFERITKCEIAIGNYTEALHWAQIYKDAEEKANGAGSLEYCEANKLIAHVNFLQENYEEALHIYRETLSIQKRNDSLDKTLKIHHTTMDIFNVSLYLGKFDEAISELEEYSRQAKTNFGEKSLEYAQTFESIGYAYYIQNKYQQALEYFNGALSVYQKGNTEKFREKKDMVEKIISICKTKLRVDDL